MTPTSRTEEMLRMGELAESIETLKGRGPKDLESLSIELAAWMVVSLLDVRGFLWMWPLAVRMGVTPGLGRGFTQPSQAS